MQIPHNLLTLFVTNPGHKQYGYGLLVPDLVVDAELPLDLFGFSIGREQSS